MSINNKKYLTAVALIDLMLGIAVGAVILAGLVGMFSSYSRFNTSSLETTRLEYEMRTALALMVGDIRRSGYSGNALSMVNTTTNNNPFMASGVDLQAPTASCVLMCYDKNKDGTLAAMNTAGGDERYGYRLSGGALQTRAATDTKFACNDGTWENLTNPTNVAITSMSVTLAPTVVFINGVDNTGGTMTTRMVTVSMTGNLVKDTGVQRTLAETIRVRNDVYTPAP